VQLPAAGWGPDWTPISPGPIGGGHPTLPPIGTNVHQVCVVHRLLPGRFGLSASVRRPDGGDGLGLAQAGFLGCGREGGEGLVLGSALVAHGAGGPVQDGVAVAFLGVADGSHESAAAPRLGEGTRGAGAGDVPRLVSYALNEPGRRRANGNVVLDDVGASLGGAAGADDVAAVVVAVAAHVEHALDDGGLGGFGVVDDVPFGVTHESGHR
jgi:hypothetical protein